jgi:RNA polymerase sigma factor (sigma-70 family)
MQNFATSDHLIVADTEYEDRAMRVLLQQILSSRRDSEETDAELLRQFADRRDGDAFAQLVDRYGSLVWGQCRHLLASEADAEDAFQATFLVLARRAKSIRAANRLGPWLHGVAYRVCQNARRAAARRTRREQVAAVPEATRPVADSAWDALLAAVHEELHGLPGKLREAFILCYLEGKTSAQAAEQLGLKLGTFSARLSRAKERLLARLEARNLASGAGLLAALPGGPASAALVQRAVEFAITPAVVPAAILTLTQGVLFMGLKLKAVTACLLLAVVLALGGLWSVHAQVPTGPNIPPVGGGPQLPGAAQPDLPELRREIDRLRDLIVVKERDLAARQAALERERTSEFRYLSQQPGYAPTQAEFEKTVRENEKEGYHFVGVVNLKVGHKYPNVTPTGPAGPPTEAVPTLVFRKQAGPAHSPEQAK